MTFGQLEQLSIKRLIELGYSRLAFLKAIGLVLNPAKEQQYMSGMSFKRQIPLGSLVHLLK